MLTTQKVAVTNPYVSKVAELSGAPYFHSRWFYILWHSFSFLHQMSFMTQTPHLSSLVTSKRSRQAAQTGCVSPPGLKAS